VLTEVRRGILSNKTTRPVVSDLIPSLRIVNTSRKRAVHNCSVYQPSLNAAAGTSKDNGSRAAHPVTRAVHNCSVYQPSLNAAVGTSKDNGSRAAHPLTRAVHNCSVYQPSLNAAVGTSKDNGSRAAHPVECTNSWKFNCLKGSSSLVNGTACAQVIDERVGRVDDVSSSPMVDYVSRDAARRVDLNRQYAKSDLRSSKSIPRPGPDSSDLT
jgi:hypothetical protein